MGISSRLGLELGVDLSRAISNDSYDTEINQSVEQLVETDGATPRPLRFTDLGLCMRTFGSRHLQLQD